MSKDIREKSRLVSNDILGLNFVKSPGIYSFRKHYRMGLRSHIMEVLNPSDLERENRGITVDGLKWFPKAKPLKMLRIFRTRFHNLDDALEELKRVKIVEKYLAPEHMARSEEFLVTYMRQGTHHLLLCGLQEYVEGEILDPWSPIDDGHLVALLGRMDFKRSGNAEGVERQWVARVRKKAKKFIQNIRKMIVNEAHIPDLAGVGNLLLTRTGDIKLVDINNISRVSFDPVINLDDRGYPVCDKSVEALSLLDRKLLSSIIGNGDEIYGLFLDPKRMKDVKAMAMEFHERMELGIGTLSYPQ
jgi:hypothetical protein